MSRLRAISVALLLSALLAAPAVHCRVSPSHAVDDEDVHGTARQLQQAFTLDGPSPAAAPASPSIAPSPTARSPATAAPSPTASHTPAPAPATAAASPSKAPTATPTKGIVFSSAPAPAPSAKANTTATANATATPAASATPAPTDFATTTVTGSDGGSYTTVVDGGWGSGGGWGGGGWGGGFGNSSNMSSDGSITFTPDASQDTGSNTTNFTCPGAHFTWNQLPAKVQSDWTKLYKKYNKSQPATAPNMTIFMWVSVPIGECSVKCGGGQQLVNTYCSMQKMDVHTNTTCEVGSFANDDDWWTKWNWRPPFLYMYCQPPNYMTTAPGSGGAQISSPYARPANSVPCNTLRCDTYSLYWDEWSLCAPDTTTTGGKWCGSGKQQRAVRCRSTLWNTFVTMDNCAADLVPLQSRDDFIVGPDAYIGWQYRTCNTPSSCDAQYTWTVGGFSACSGGCMSSIASGPAKRTRSVQCMNARTNTPAIIANSTISLCPDINITSSQVCGNMPCKQLWTIGAWSKCNASCDGGVQTRDVTCAATAGCFGDAPPSQRACNQQPCSLCPTTTTSTAGSTSSASSSSGHSSYCGPNSQTCSSNVCQCNGGYSGTYCEQQGSCSGILARGNSCCKSAVLDIYGRCCGDGEVLDSSGMCCNGTVDACGVCNGTSVIGFDVLMQCCPAGSSLDAMGVCCAGVVDLCGVCGGDGSACNAVIAIDLALDNTTSTSVAAVNASAIAAIKSLYGAGRLSDARDVVPGKGVATPTPTPAPPTPEPTWGGWSGWGGGSGRRLLASANATDRIQIILNSGTPGIDAPTLATSLRGVLPGDGSLVGFEVFMQSNPNNSFCEWGEWNDTSSTDCVPLKTCSAPSTMGVVTQPCGANGVCNRRTGECECFVGYNGTDCGLCAWGYVSHAMPTGETRCVTVFHLAPSPPAGPPKPKKPIPWGKIGPIIGGVVGGLIVLGGGMFLILFIKRKISDCIEDARERRENKAAKLKAQHSAAHKMVHATATLQRSGTGASEKFTGKVPAPLQKKAHHSTQGGGMARQDSGPMTPGAKSWQMSSAVASPQGSVTSQSVTSTTPLKNAPQFARTSAGSAHFRSSVERVNSSSSQRAARPSAEMQATLRSSRAGSGTAQQAGPFQRAASGEFPAPGAGSNPTTPRTGPFARMGSGEMMLGSAVSTPRTPGPLQRSASGERGTIDTAQNVPKSFAASAALAMQRAGSNDSMSRIVQAAGFAAAAAQSPSAAAAAPNSFSSQRAGPLQRAASGEFSAPRSNASTPRSSRGPFQRTVSGDYSQYSNPSFANMPQLTLTNSATNSLTVRHGGALQRAASGDLGGRGSPHSHASSPRSGRGPFARAASGELSQASFVSTPNARRTGPFQRAASGEVPRSDNLQNAQGATGSKWL